jgi:hypothetical protein
MMRLARLRVGGSFKRRFEPQAKLGQNVESTHKLLPLRLALAMEGRYRKPRNLVARQMLDEGIIVIRTDVFKSESNAAERAGHL